MRENIVAFGEHFTGIRVEHAVCGETPIHAALHRLTGDIVSFANPDAIVSAAVVFVDDDVLCNVHETAGEVTGIRCTERGIGEALAGAVR